MPPLSCRVLGHHWRFAVEETAVVWICDRCGHDGGRRDYDSRDEARRYAHALNRGGNPPTGFIAALGGTLARGERGKRR